jgi:hypothetical protein
VGTLLGHCYATYDQGQAKQPNCTWNFQRFHNELSLLMFNGEFSIRFEIHANVTQLSRKSDVYATHEKPPRRAVVFQPMLSG